MNTFSPTPTVQRTSLLDRPLVALFISLGVHALVAGLVVLTQWVQRPLPQPQLTTELISQTELATVQQQLAEARSNNTEPVVELPPTQDSQLVASSEQPIPAIVEKQKVTPFQPEPTPEPDPEPVESIFVPVTPPEPAPQQPVDDKAEPSKKPEPQPEPIKEKQAKAPEAVKDTPKPKPEPKQPEEKPEPVKQKPEPKKTKSEWQIKQEEANKKQEKIRKEQEEKRAKARAEATAKRKAEEAERKKQQQEKKAKEAAALKAAKQKEKEAKARKEAAKQEAKKRREKREAAQKAAKEKAAKVSKPVSLSGDKDPIENDISDEIAKLSQQKSEPKPLAVESTPDYGAMTREYEGKIQRKITQRWQVPAGTSGLSAEVSIRIAPNGAVRGTSIIKSSGDKGFDNSLIKAIEAASPLPIPDDRTLYRKSFSEIDFNFNGR